MAHETEAKISAAEPTRLIVSVLPATEPISKTTAQTQMSMPSTAVKLGRRPAGRNPSISTIHRGTVATSSAARLEVTNCSAQTTPPLPPTKRKTPMIAALRHSNHFGAESPLIRRMAYKNPPETMKRAAAIEKGG